MARITVTARFDWDLPGWNGRVTRNYPPGQYIVTRDCADYAIARGCAVAGWPEHAEQAADGGEGASPAGGS